MQFSSLLIFPLLASASFLPDALRPDGSTLVQDILRIDRAVTSLTTKIASLTGGSISTTILEGAPVLLDAVSIHFANRKGYYDAKLAADFTAEEAAEIVDTVTKTVAVNIPETVNQLMAKRVVFAESGLSSVVIKTMEVLMSDHDSFSEAVLEKAGTISAAKRIEGQNGVDIIHAKLLEGIAIFKAGAKKDKLKDKLLKLKDQKLKEEL